MHIGFLFETFYTYTSSRVDKVWKKLLNILRVVNNQSHSFLQRVHYRKPVETPERRSLRWRIFSFALSRCFIFFIFVESRRHSCANQPRLRARSTSFYVEFSSVSSVSFLQVARKGSGSAYLIVGFFIDAERARYRNDFQVCALLRDRVRYSNVKTAVSCSIMVAQCATQCTETEIRNVHVLNKLHFHLVKVTRALFQETKLLQLQLTQFIEFYSFISLNILLIEASFLKSHHIIFLRHFSNRQKRGKVFKFTIVIKKV